MKIDEKIFKLKIIWLMFIFLRSSFSNKSEINKSAFFIIFIRISKTINYKNVGKKSHLSTLSYKKNTNETSLENTGKRCE